jgi:hypothetical protein
MAEHRENEDLDRGRASGTGAATPQAGTTVSLRDGTVVRLRRIGPEDAPRLIALYDRRIAEKNQR